VINDNSFLYFEDIIKIINQDYEIEGNPRSVKVNKITTLDEADEVTLIWIKSSQPDKEDIIRNTKAKAIICDQTVSVSEDDLRAEGGGKCLIKVEEPKYAIIRVIEKYFQKQFEAGIHRTVTIDSRARIAGNVYIGPNVYIGKVEIGSGVVIIGNSYLYDNTVLKKDVILQAGTVIGSDGFGHFKDNDKRLIHFPHLGRVILDQDVLIGCNTVINRGTLGETYIGKGNKINKLCVVSHNVIMGVDNFVASSACINGSARIGNNNYIGAGAIIRNKVSVGNDTVVGMGAVVVKDVRSNTMVYGNPAEEVDRSPNKPLY